MATQEGENVFVAAIQGNFDDAQSGVKKLFCDPQIATALQKQNRVFSSANSINWGRLLPQIVYYVSAYCDLVRDEQIALGDPINVCVPTGNFGNILAAYYAKQIGLPIHKLICASNKNNVLTDFISTGTYEMCIRDRDWCNYYKEQGIAAIPTDCRSGKGIKQFVPTVKEVLRPLLERRAQKGMQGAPIRLSLIHI